MTITTAQRSFIESLLRPRLATLGMADMDEATTKLNLAGMTKQDASTIIGRLKGMPRDPDPTMPEVVAMATRSGKPNRAGRCGSCGHDVPAGAGFYYLAPDGRWNAHHVVGACSVGAPPPPTAPLTEGIYVVESTSVPKIILIYRTGNNRLAGKVWTGRSYIYRQGAAAEAASGRLITWQEAQHYGITSGVCIACAKDLTDGRSTEVGYGPVCAKKYGWPWG